MKYLTYKKFKYSGNDYLGNIPSHWETRKLKFYSYRVFTGTTPKSSNNEYYANPTEDWYTPIDFSDDKLDLKDSKRKLNLKAIEDGEVYRFPEKSILIVSIGSIGKVGISKTSFLCNQQINVIAPNYEVNPYFLAYSLKIKTEIMKMISNATILGIMNQEKTKLIEVSAPLVEEQTKIVEFLDYKTAQIDQLIEKKKTLIEKLKEYRTALITAAVTGKIDVRGFDINKHKTSATTKKRKSSDAG